MNRKLGYCIAFVVGSAVGFVGSMKYFEKKYEQYATDEIEHIRELYGKKRGGEDEPEVDDKQERTEEVVLNGTAREKYDREKYREVLGRTNYADFSNKDPRPPVEEIVKPRNKDMIQEEPYIIQPEEFGDTFENDTIEITYYAGDSILADDGDFIMTDIEGSIGNEALDLFLDPNVEIVYVRNDRLRLDYEISRDSRSYEVVVEGKIPDDTPPHKMR